MWVQAASVLHIPGELSAHQPQVMIANDITKVVSSSNLRVGLCRTLFQHVLTTLLAVLSFESSSEHQSTAMNHASSQYLGFRIQRRSERQCSHHREWSSKARTFLLTARGCVPDTLSARPGRIFDSPAPCQPAATDRPGRLQI